jgi:hypothetical protein
MTEDPLVAALLATARLWDETATYSAGICRIAARRIQELEAELGRRRVPSPDPCGRCGAPVEQPMTGRPRKFCFGCSPKKAENPSVEVEVTHEHSNH